MCAKTGVLCGACEHKLTSGKITETDVELSKIFCGIFKGGAGFMCAVESDGQVIIVVDAKDVGRVIGPSGKNLSEISRRLGRAARVIGSGDTEKTIYDLIAPARIVKINKVYNPEGTVLRVIINAEDREKLRIGEAQLKRILESVAMCGIEFTFMNSE